MVKKLTTLVKLARFTRKFPRMERPFAHAFSTWLRKRLCPPGRRPFHRLVMDYDKGLINIDTASVLEHRILFQGYHEREIAQLIKNTVKPGSVCLDIGANIGAHTLLMAFTAGPSGRVIAVEPHPQVAARLAGNVALNRLTNVSILQAAVSDSDGTAAFFVMADDALNQATSSLKQSERHAKEIQVRTVSGQSLQREFNITSCDLVKIDVEGAEMVVLKGLSDLIARCRPHLIFEYVPEHWTRFNSSVKDCIQLLREWNYTIYVVRHYVIRPLEEDVTGRCDFFCVPRASAPQ